MKARNLFSRVPFFVALAIVLSLPTSIPGADSADGVLAAEAAKKSGDNDKKKGGEEAGKEASAAKGKGKVEEKKAVKRDLEAWGPVKPVKDSDFWTLTYTKVEKGKAKREAFFVQITAQAEFYLDKMIQLSDLKEGDTIWLFGKRLEKEAPSSAGYLGVDRQLKNVSAIVVGEGFEVNKSYKDPKDPEAHWFEVEVAKEGPAISVSYEGQVYKVGLAQQSVVVRREKGGDVKRIKANTSIIVSADKTEDRPKTTSSSDAKKESFIARTVVLMDPRLRAFYPMVTQ